MNFLKVLLFLFSATFSLNGEVWTDCSREFIDKPIVDKAKLAGDECVKAAIDTAQKAGKSAAGVGLAAQNAAIKNLSFAQNLGRNLRAAALTTGVTTAISGGKLGRNVLSGLGSATVNTVSANLAHQIGERYANGSGDMSWLTHKLCHFVLGGTAAELTGRDFLAGGSGAAIGEMVCEHIQRDLLERTFRQAEELGLNDDERMDLFLQNIEKSERYGRLAAAGTALISRMDITVADSSAHTAIDENSIPHFIVGGAVLTYVAYDYFQTLANEGWEGLFQQIQEEFGESIAMGGGNPVMVTGTFVTKKLERISAKLLSTRFGSFLEKRLIKPGTKAFNDFVEFLVSKVSGLQVAFAGEGKIVSKELKVSVQESSTLFSKKLSEKAKQGGSAVSKPRFNTKLEDFHAYHKNKVSSGQWEKVRSQVFRDKASEYYYQIDASYEYGHREFEVFQGIGKKSKHLGVLRENSEKPGTWFLDTSKAKKDRHLCL